MKDRLNIAMLGYGGIGRVHSINYRQLPLIYPGVIPEPVLYAVCTSRKQSAEAAQSEAGFRVATDDLEQILGDPAVDVVDVCLPNSVHREVAVRSLGAGKHVYCEKPLAGNIQDARVIAEAASTASAQFGMVFNYRFFPATMRAKELIEQGRVGRVFTYRAEYLHSGYQDPNRPLSWRMKREEGGSGALGDLGSHAIDLIRYLLGEFISVQGHLETLISERPVARGASERGPVTVDDVAWLRTRMADGAVGTIEASRFATGTLDDLRLWIYGEKGALHFDLMDPSFLYWFDETRPRGDFGGDRGWQRLETVSNYPGAVAPPARAPIGWARSHAENQMACLKAISEGLPPSPGVVDGLRTQLVLDATERSAAAGGVWVDVEPE
jgi:predicted dehydrogenase